MTMTATSAADVVELCERAGIELQPWQLHVMRRVFDGQLTSADDATCDATEGGYWCTLPPAHKGALHVAEGSHHAYPDPAPGPLLLVVAWPQVPNTPI